MPRLSRIVFFVVLLGYCAVQAAIPEVPTIFMETFNDAKIQGKLQGGAVLDKNSGMEKGALLSVSDASPNQIVYSLEFKARPGEKFAFGINYKTEAGSGSNRCFIHILFKNASGRQVAPVQTFSYPATRMVYSYGMGEFSIPKEAAGFQILFRNRSRKGEKVWFDNLRIGRIREDGTARFIHMTNFETTFDQWCLDQHLIYERFCLGNGGKIRNEWKEAKIGEAFFECRGSLEPMQYSLVIRHLNVKPEHNYMFEAFYKATENFSANGHGILIFFQKDKQGRLVGETRFHIRPTENKWMPLFHAFKTRSDCVTVDIGLNTRKMTDKEYVRLDHLRFKEATGSLSFKFDIDPDKHTLSCIAAPFGFEEQKQKIDLSVFIHKIDGKIIFRENLQPGQARVINLNQFADGYYLISAEMKLEDGRKFLSEPQKIAFCRNPSWMNNKIGVLQDEDEPPAPWTALRYPGKNEVVTWNDRFVFGDMPVPERISSLFAVAPVFSINGTPVRNASPLTWRRNPSRAKAQFACEGTGWRGSGEISVNYSGFYHFSLDVLAGSPEFRMKSGKLSMQLKNLDFLYRSDDSWTEIGAVDLRKNPRWQTRHFYNEMQFGTMDSGIVWYAPKVCPAVSDLQKSWIQVDAGKNLIEIEMVNEEVELTPGRKFRIEFALAPYPFRPSLDFWKKLRFRAGKYNNFGLIWHTPEIFKYCGSTAEAADDGTNIRYYLNSRKPGSVMLFYQFPFYISETIPEWSYFRKYWQGVPSRGYDMGKTGMALKGDVRQKTWQDFYLDKFKKHLQEYDWDGVYYDCFGTELYMENGEQFHPVFDTMGFQERIFMAQREKKKNSITVTHLGGAQFNTAAAYSDIVLMGEQYRGPLWNHDYYTDFMTLDEFRFENAVKLGPDRMFLPQYGKKEQQRDPCLATHVMGIALLHNLMLYPSYINKEVQLAIRYRLHEFGLQNATFYPYWKRNQKNIDINNPEVKFSFWNNEKGYFLTIFNPTKKTQDFVLSSDEKMAKTVLYQPEKNVEYMDVLNKKFSLPANLAFFVRLDQK